MAKPRDPKTPQPSNPPPRNPTGAKSDEPARFDLDAPSRAAELRCPLDNSEMEKVTIHNVIVDRCTACGAIWFDVPELSQVLDIKGAAALIDKPPRSRAKTRSGPVLCPRDRSEMKVKTDPLQQHVSLHRCPMCLGILLKGGDLLDLSEFTLKERIASFFGQ
jgi:uncharacterized protein